MPTADLVISRPGHPGLLVDPPVVLDRGSAVARHHPRHDRLRALIVTGIGSSQRWQTRSVNVDLMLCHARNRSRLRAIVALAAT